MPKYAKAGKRDSGKEFRKRKLREEPALKEKINKYSFFRYNALEHSPQNEVKFGAR